MSDNIESVNITQGRAYELNEDQPLIVVVKMESGVERRFGGRATQR